ncbi:lipopolysaccharide assembly protein LapA domain-containing protein [Lentzea sp. BCCO 10_0798]|uniref:Lipopolysaccharide assembly protein LapA domain-containing protein n=1 Tax=Lentzea kristufekii TaxID=3095430 RepID=A0ABU4TY15_9PSEU|nr:lipopolysaccharide assembly protein LapA domain-containing protein [Lentzea sp. BCCO 10_0798]MDX8053087.1 lipopolysaccharide assembly protein LapA domain-containing protein [Lentzea sp. BCCO 10_0798]
MATSSDETPKTPVTEPIPAAPPTAAPPAPVAAPKKLRPTRISGTWIAVLVAIVVLIFLLIFILQNGGNATIHFLWGQFSLPLGVALLFGAIGGALLVAVVGAARILQLRRQAKRTVPPTGRPSTSSPARRES